MTSNKAIQTVIYFLGSAVLLSIAGLVWLVHSTLAKAQVDASAVGLIASVAGLAGTTSGALGALLVSTRSAPAPDAPPTPVTVENAPDEAVPVQETPAKGR